MAREHQKRYIGSTSSISATLSQFYFAMSNFKPVNISGLSPVFKDMVRNYYFYRFVDNNQSIV